MKSERIKEFEEALPVCLKNARIIRMADKMVGISGSRIKLPLKGREIMSVFYKARSENAPLIIGFHGGGFLYGGCSLDDAMWAAVSESLDVNIVSVGYRQSPEFKWRTSLEDCWDSVLYLAENSTGFGFDRDHISVMGQSAGANLAACMVMKNNELRALKFDNQILLYPFLDLAADPDSKGAGSFSGIICYVMNELHSEESERKNPYISPVFAPEGMLLGGPKASVVLCTEDNMLPEGSLFCDKLKAAGVETAVMTAQDMPHGYFEVGFKDRISDLEEEILGPGSFEKFENGSIHSAALNTLEFLKKEFKR